MGKEVVLPNGEIIWLGNACVKDVAGFSLKDLFIGSEGCLGIITRVLLRLVPMPAAKRTLVATFDRMEDAAQTVSDLIAGRIIPCTLEFLDQDTIRCVEDFAKIGLPRDVEALLLMETDGAAAVVDAEAEAMEEIARRNGAREVRKAKDSEEAVELAQARRGAFSALARLKPTTILEDATVPRSELVKMVKGVREIAVRHRLRIANFGHMGDGNLHPTFLTDEKDTAEMERVEVAMREIFDLAISLGGTITGEHGVGLAKKSHLPSQFRDYSLNLLKDIKATLDPDNLFNPGKVV
jgi:glycolate oxidase